MMRGEKGKRREEGREGKEGNEEQGQEETSVVRNEGQQAEGMEERGGGEQGKQKSRPVLCFHPRGILLSLCWYYASVGRVF